MPTANHTTYPAKSAGRHLLSAVPTVPAQTTVSEARKLLTSNAKQWDTLSYTYVLDAAGRPIGAVSIKELLRANSAEPIASIMSEHLIVTHPHTPREHVAQIAIHRGIKAVPIVDRHGKFLGVMGTDAILETLHEDHVEDFLRFAGVQGKTVTDVLRTSLRDLVRARLPWLIIGFLGAMIGTLIVRAYDQLLVHEVALASFIPLIVYMAAAVGVQTQTLYIRTLAREHVDLAPYLRRELTVTGVMSLAAAAILFSFAYVGTRSIAIAYSVSFALIASILVATVLALIVATVLARNGKDPAFGGGPLANALQDAVSLGIYLTIAWVILS